MSPSDCSAILLCVRVYRFSEILVRAESRGISVLLGDPTVKTDVHPNYVACKVVCACGNAFETRAVKDNIHVEICSQCHPFFTGKQKFIDTEGRVERFRKRYSKAGK